MIKIAYSGSLSGFDPSHTDVPITFFARWFWTFRNSVVDSSTRSGYYLIQAIRLLRDKYSVGYDQLKVYWWGNIDSLNMLQVKKEGLEHYFECDGYVEKWESTQRMKAADLFFLPLEKSKVTDQRTLFIPGKLYEYLREKKPVLALCEDSDCKAILERSGLGIFASPDDPEDIALVLYRIVIGDIRLEYFVADHSYIQEFSFEKKTSELAAVFDSCLSRTTSVNG